jgi:hypothetical protein
VKALGVQVVTVSVDDVVIADMSVYVVAYVEVRVTTDTVAAGDTEQTEAVVDERGVSWIDVEDRIEEVELVTVDSYTVTI